MTLTGLHELMQDIFDNEIMNLCKRGQEEYASSNDSFSNFKAAGKDGFGWKPSATAKATRCLMTSVFSGSRTCICTWEPRFWTACLAVPLRVGASLGMKELSGWRCPRQRGRLATV